jgi:hypothetical protein
MFIYSVKGIKTKLFITVLKVLTIEFERVACNFLRHYWQVKKWRKSIRSRRQLISNKCNCWENIDDKKTKGYKIAVINKQASILQKLVFQCFPIFDLKLDCLLNVEKNSLFNKRPSLIVKICFNKKKYGGIGSRGQFHLYLRWPVLKSWNWHLA